MVPRRKPDQSELRESEAFSAKEPINEHALLSFALSRVTVRKGKMSGVRLTDDSPGACLPILADILETPLIAVSPHGLINLWGQAAQDRFGYMPAEVVGHPFSILLAGEGKDGWHETSQKLKGVDRFFEAKTICRAKDGTDFPMQLTYVPARDKRARLKGTLVLMREVNGQRLDDTNEGHLLADELVSWSENAIIRCDADGIIRLWNPASHQLFGHTAEEIVGKPVSVLRPSDRFFEDRLVMERLRSKERLVQYETQLYRKDGELIDVSAKVSGIYDRRGQLTATVTVFTNNTERERHRMAEQAESFLGALVASADDAIISINLDGIISSWNAAAERLYGYSESEMIGRPVAILIPPDHPDEGLQILERIRQGEKIDHYETKRVRKDGTLVDVALTASPVKDASGRIIAASKIARDISVQKWAAMRERDALLQAEQARAEAVAAGQIRDEFLATVSHELRTPMTAILGWSRILLSGPLKPEVQRRAIETIERNARSQAQLIEDLLDISRIISGKLRVEFTPLHLQNVVAAAVETLRPAAEAKRIQLVMSFDSAVAPIMGDAVRLQQIVWNLLSNALRFTDPGGEVQIKLRHRETHAEISVVDNGIGIKAEFLPRVFDRFAQADSSTTRSTGGLGMGLAIVKSLVELHGGSVSVLSNGEGQGAEFTIRLPLSEARREASARNAGLLPEGVINDQLLSGMKILVVDDEADTRELLRYIFNGAGAYVETADGAVHALEVFDRLQPDVLVSDIGMPGIDGYELIRILRSERRSNIPAVALTAMTRIDDRLRTLGAGYSTHVAKPVEPRELINTVANLPGAVNSRAGGRAGRSQKAAG